MPCDVSVVVCCGFVRCAGVTRVHLYTEGWLVQPHGPEGQHSRVTYVVKFESSSGLTAPVVAALVSQQGLLVASLAQVRRRAPRSTVCVVTISVVLRVV